MSVDCDSTLAAEVPHPWDSCFQLAWESYLAGSVPIGAVVLDSCSAIVSRGRNRRFEATGPPSQLANTNIAHAEMNALIGLPPAEYSDHTLFTTLEPCLLCSVAAAHARVGGIVYAIADPVQAGMDLVPETVPYLKAHWPLRQGPIDGPLPAVSIVLQMLYFHTNSPTSRFAAVVNEEMPQLSNIARTLIESGLAAELRHRPLADVFSVLAASVAQGR
jgi:tRNA(adenine34) deaminase